MLTSSTGLFHAVASQVVKDVRNAVSVAQLLAVGVLKVALKRPSTRGVISWSMLRPEFSSAI